MKWISTISLLIFFGEVCPAKYVPSNCKDVAATSSYSGCFKDYVKNRLLKKYVGIAYTPDKCIAKCRKRGYPYAGMEFSVECFCGSIKTTLGVPVDDKSCKMPCWGDRSKMCGAEGMISVYTLNDTLCQLLANAESDSTSSVGNSHGTTDDEKNELGIPSGDDQTIVSDSVDIDMVNNLAEEANGPSCLVQDKQTSLYELEAVSENYESISYLGCFNETNPRIFIFFLENNLKLTPEYCIAQCSKREYSYAGVKYGVECYCGAADTKLGRPAADHFCDTVCWGNRKVICGGSSALSVYSMKAPDVSADKRCPLVVTSTYVTLKMIPSSSYLGCFNNSGTSPLLRGYSETYPSLTPLYCIESCSRIGYPFAGVQAGKDCYCGTLDEVYIVRFDEEIFCTMACGGDVNQNCGDDGFISIYSINDTILFRNIEFSFNWRIQENLLTDNVDKEIDSPFFHLNDFRFYVLVKRVTAECVKRIHLFLYCVKRVDKSLCGINVRWNVGFIKDNGNQLRKGLKFNTDCNENNAVIYELDDILADGYMQNYSMIMQTSIAIEN